MNNDNSSQTLFQCLTKHIVGLAITDALNNPRSSTSDIAQDFDIQVFIISTFLILVRDLWFLVTAGHTLEDTKKRLQSSRRILKSRLLDGTSGMTGSIPFDLNLSKIFHIDRDGHDYGLIQLRPLFSQSLMQGGIRPLTEKHWTDIPELADDYYLLGFPKQAQIIKITSNDNGGRISTDLGVPLLALQRIFTPPKTLESPAERFYANVPITQIPEEIKGENASLTDISGMSGGPIFGVKQIEQNKLRYWIVAIQSGWLSQSRTLAACFIKPFIDGVTKVLEQHNSDFRKDK
jgi:hypothetical protein